ncbi:hypothetical protein MJN47_29850, partial [Salmonella enterica subsp. enterica serovar Lubbock]|nr:hypothetical protein [Salmonella enterica subsp. enterica serovar Lubbock]
IYYVPADEILTHRVIWSFFFMVALLSVSRQWRQVKRLLKTPKCHQKGIEFIGTTLSGYTGPITPVEPDLAMVTQLSHAGCRVIA